MSDVKCTVCGSSPAYIGFVGNKCECSNPKCKCYSPELYPVDPAAEVIQGETKTNKTLTDDDISPRQTPLWIWSNYHHDFGD